MFQFGKGFTYVKPNITAVKLANLTFLGWVSLCFALTPHPLTYATSRKVFSFK